MNGLIWITDKLNIYKQINNAFCLSTVYKVDSNVAVLVSRILLLEYYNCPLRNTMYYWKLLCRPYCRQCTCYMRVYYYGACTGLYTGIVTGSLDNMVQKRLATLSINLNHESIKRTTYYRPGVR